MKKILSIVVVVMLCSVQAFAADLVGIYKNKESSYTLKIEHASDVWDVNCDFLIGSKGYKYTSPKQIKDNDNIIPLLNDKELENDLRHSEYLKYCVTAGKTNQNQAYKIIFEGKDKNKLQCPFLNQKLPAKQVESWLFFGLMKLLDFRIENGELELLFRPEITDDPKNSNCGVIEGIWKKQ